MFLHGHALIQAKIQWRWFSILFQNIMYFLIIKKSFRIFYVWNFTLNILFYGVIYLVNLSDQNLWGPRTNETLCVCLLMRWEHDHQHPIEPDCCVLPWPPASYWAWLLCVAGVLVHCWVRALQTGFRGQSLRSWPTVILWRITSECISVWVWVCVGGGIVITPVGWEREREKERILFKKKKTVCLCG